MLRVPRLWDSVKTAVPMKTVHSETEEIVEVPAGTRCEIAGIYYLPGVQGLQFCLAPRFGDYQLGELLTMQIDETDLIDGCYPFDVEATTVVKETTDDGTSGQDRDSYSDTQDRDSYTVED